MRTNDIFSKDVLCNIIIYATLATFSGQIVNCQKEQAGKPED